MGTSRAFASPGLRIHAIAACWRADFATIAATLRGHPTVLVPGTIGFALRGGIALLTLPILILPTSVEVRFLLGNNLGSTGLTGGFLIVMAALSVLTLVVAIAVLYVLARCELALFTRFVNSTEPSGAHAWPPPGRLAAQARRGVTARLFVVEALGLLAVLLAAVPLAAAVGQSTLSEILLPSSTDSIYVRILNDVALPLIGWLAAIVGIEALSAMTVRHVLAGAFDLVAYERIHRHPLRAVLVALIGWVLFVGALTIGLLALALTWDAVRFVFLSTGLSGGAQELAGALVVALFFGGVFAASLLLGGLVSTVRAGLWTLASLR